ncbi:winged helix DNA-binding domain-containing protein [Raineyella sp.]|uniref:winged helix DNA-binding domain-containing protein n=1 Tax=Raineyella sp. TaxID=1911550 RepID=UPI002B21271F|nr:winged helix DNA-binding domain-containing protein [Raineyella sp.]MEA5153411.1 winged helix DNA-binding domain-containing protein [Raineyella sp.]
MERRALLAQRLATQRLTAAPADPVAVVGEALAVQSQDAPMARWSIGMRSGTPGPEVAAAVDRGRIVRTHVLRPTWHYVLPVDLRWLLALSAARIERSMGARHRQLRITEPVVERAFEVIRAAITEQGPLTRRRLHPLLPTTGFPEQGQVVGHLLMLAELRELVVSGPSAGDQHTYALMDDVVPPATPRPREDLVRELTARFFAGHGPASIRELTRWAAVTQAEIRRALDELGLASVTFDGVELWWDPAAVHEETRPRRAHLLPTFDEATLTYLAPSWQRTDGHPMGDRPPTYARVGGGVVICDLAEVGLWQRRATGATTRVTLALSPAVSAPQRQAIIAEAQRLADFEGRPLELAD